MPTRATDPRHSAHALIDRRAVAHNARQLRQCAPDSQLMAVIKANAYGHGLLRIAAALEPLVDAFAVARTQEGLNLRHDGIRRRIAVLQGFMNAEELEIHACNGLEPVIHSPWQVELLERTTLPRPLPIWLKLDTGMHRLGLLPEEFVRCRQRLERNPNVITPLPVMTHFASADERENPFTREQLSLYRRVVGDDVAENNLANSAGTLAWKAARREWVRPGIALYGISPFPESSGPDEGLKPVMTLKSRLISIKPLQPGDRVGYGGDWLCPTPTRIGIAAIGYGDGYPRHAPSGTPVLIRGKCLPLAGRVSMDLISIDLGDCPEATVGDEVTLWGEGLPVELIARWATTIPYELVCGITQRVTILER